MDATTKKLCQMLKSGDAELRAAAARVLGELGPKEGAVLGALSEVLTGDAGPARLYALGALAHSGTPQAVGYILPAMAGPRAAASALARIGGKAAHELLFRGLAGGELELSKHICFELDLRIQEMGERGRAALLSQTQAYLGQKRTQKNEVATVSGLILLGFLNSPKAKKTLLAFSRRTHSSEVRRRALLALRGIAGELSSSEVKTLAGYLGEDDLGNVVLPTIELLRPLPLPPAVAARLLGLATSPHRPVRDFAIYKMGRLDTPAAAKRLVAYLDAPQPALRELALASLRRNAAAVPLLLRRLKAEQDHERLRTLARVLEPHASDLSSAQSRSLTTLLLGYLENDDRRAEPLSYLLRRVAPKQLDAALLKRARSLKSKKRYAEANRLLRTLVRGGAASPEALYQAAAVGLKVSPKGLGRTERNADTCLRLLDRLIDEGAADLARRLCSDGILEPADLFYVGFHFAEQLRERRELGGALLRYLVRTKPRSAAGRNARNKLRLAAFPVEKPKARKGAGRVKKKAAKPKAARKKAAKKSSRASRSTKKPTRKGS